MGMGMGMAEGADPRWSDAPRALDQESPEGAALVLRRRGARALHGDVGDLWWQGLPGGSIWR